MLRAPTTALASPGGVARLPRARVAARGETAAARGAFPVGAADARARWLDVQYFQDVRVASLPRRRTRLRLRVGVGARRRRAPAPPTTPTRPSRPRRVIPAPRAGLHPRLSLAALASCVACWKAVVACAVLFSKFHLQHYTLSLKALYLEVFSFAIVGTAAFWVVKTALAEAQEQARLVPPRRRPD